MIVFLLEKLCGPKKWRYSIVKSDCVHILVKMRRVNPKMNLLFICKTFHPNGLNSFKDRQVMTPASNDENFVPIYIPNTAPLIIKLIACLSDSHVDIQLITILLKLN